MKATEAQRRARAKELQAKRDALRERVRMRRERGRPEKKPSRRRWWLLALLLPLLLLFLRDCRCTEPAEGTAIPVATPTPIGEMPFIGPPAPTLARVRRRDRPEISTPPPQPVPWLAAFRMQVAARGPRLAECFEGAARPGRLKWTTSVAASDGRVSDHSLEPMLLTDDLTWGERQCVLGVLSDPAYRLEASQGRSTPSRVGLVIEF